jgi:hypothetical protein
MDTKEKIAMASLVVAILTGWKAELKPIIARSRLTLWRFLFALSIGYLTWWCIDQGDTKAILLVVSMAIGCLIWWIDRQSCKHDQNMGGLGDRITDMHNRLDGLVNKYEFKSLRQELRDHKHIK